MLKGIDKQPVAAVEWVDRETLRANDYNPNKQASPEFELLKVSILENGWTQPIVARRDGEIVDGFHRWSASADKRLHAMTGGKVPVVFLSDETDKATQVMATIRHNRARGMHGVLKMADIVRDLIEQGADMAELMDRLGMEDEEVMRLADRAGMPLKVAKDGGAFGKAWRPTKEGK